MSGEASALRMILTLGVAGFLSGATVVGAYEATKPAIERNRAAALEHALFEVLPGATRREAFVVRDGALVPFEGEGIPHGEEAVYAGYDDGGTRIGFAIPAEGPGFQDTIGILYGYDPATRTILGMRVLQSLETPGLGDKIIKDPHFLAEFEGLAVDPEIVAVKEGTGAKNEVDTISGATISSKSVVRILNEANTKWLHRLPGGGGTP